MNSIEATSRDTKTKGQLNDLRKNGEVPAVIYGGKEENQKISLDKKKNIQLDQSTEDKK